MRKNTKQPVETALKTFKDGEAQRPTTTIPLSDEASKSQQDVADVLKSTGTIEKSIDVTTFWSRD